MEVAHKLESTGHIAYHTPQMLLPDSVLETSFRGIALTLAQRW